MPTKRSRAPSSEDIEFSETVDGASLDYTSDERIRTIEDAIRYGGVDTSVYYVHKWTVKSWEVTTKCKTPGGFEKPVRKGMWGVHLDLRRIVPRALHEAGLAILERMKAHAPRYPKFVRPKAPGDPHCLEVDLFDVHFGKLAWARETGQDYDLKIAEQVYRNAVEDLVAKFAGYNIDQFVLPIGNDFLHADNAESATTKGTRVDTESRHAKLYTSAFAAVIWAVEYMLKIARVKVILVEGNHDGLSSYHLAHAVKGWFRNCPDVDVDCEPTPRHYLRYGTCLIGYTHGNEESVKDLTGILATERPRDWSETTCHEWRLGHNHRPKARESVSIDSHLGVVTRWLHSLSATDAWHARKGYIGTRRAAEGHLLSYSEGYSGFHLAYARES